MPKSKKAAEDIAAYEIERLRKNASQKREQRQRSSAAQKAVHALQEQQRRQRASHAAQKEVHALQGGDAVVLAKVQGQKDRANERKL